MLRTTLAHKSLVIVALLSMTSCPLTQAKEKTKRNVCEELLSGAGAGAAGRVVSLAIVQAGYSPEKALVAGAITALLAILGLSSSEETVDKKAVATKAAGALVTFAGTTYFIPTPKK